MKKIIATTVGLMLAGGVAATSAMAVESQFGGYWRTRAFFMDNYSHAAEILPKTHSTLVPVCITPQNSVMI